VRQLPWHTSRRRLVHSVVTWGVMGISGAGCTPSNPAAARAPCATRLCRRLCRSDSFGHRRGSRHVSPGLLAASLWTGASVNKFLTRGAAVALAAALASAQAPVSQHHATEPRRG